MGKRLRKKRCKGLQVLIKSNTQPRLEFLNNKVNQAGTVGAVTMPGLRVAQE